ADRAGVKSAVRLGGCAAIGGVANRSARSCGGHGYGYHLAEQEGAAVRVEDGRRGLGDHGAEAPGAEMAARAGEAAGVAVGHEEDAVGEDGAGPMELIDRAGPEN